MRWLESSRPSLHPLHVRHHRQAQRRAARHRRLRGGARRVDARIFCGGRATRCSPPATSRLGGRPLVHHLRAAAQRHGHHHVRGLPIRPDPAIGGRSSPTTRSDDVQLADRDPRAQEARTRLRRTTTRRCKYLFLAGEPLDEPTALGRRITRRRDHRQLLADRNRMAHPVGAARRRGTRRASSAARRSPCTGYDVTAAHEGRARRSDVDEKGVLTVTPPLPPGCLTTDLGRRRALRATYFDNLPRPPVYSTFDWATATPTATTSCSAAPTTSSTSPGTAWARARSRRRCRRTPASPRSPWSASPIQLKGQIPVAFAVVRTRIPSPRAEGVARDAEGSDGHRGPGTGRHRAARRRPLRHRAAQDAPASSPVDPGAAAEDASGRSHDGRGTGRAGADPGVAGGLNRGDREPDSRARPFPANGARASDNRRPRGAQILPPQAGREVFAERRRSRAAKNSLARQGGQQP